MHLSNISITTPPTNRDIAVYVPGNRIFLSIHPTPKDIVKAKCMTEHWDKVVNPWLYLQSNRGAYDVHRDAIHSTTPAGAAQLALRDCRSIPGNPPIVGNFDHLVDEVEQKKRELDDILYKRALITDYNGAVFDGQPYVRVWRGMSVPYNPDPLGDYKILNYLHTSIDKGVATAFIHGPDATIYYFDVTPGIPYISYDNNPFESQFQLAEQEIMFMRNVVARPISDRELNPAIDANFYSQHLQLIPAPAMLATLKQSRDVIEKYDSTSMYYTNIHDAILTLCGSPVQMGGKRKTRKYRKR